MIYIWIMLAIIAICIIIYKISWCETEIKNLESEIDFMQDLIKK